MSTCATVWLELLPSDAKVGRAIAELGGAGYLIQTLGFLRLRAQKRARKGQFLQDRQLLGMFRCFHDLSIFRQILLESPIR